MFLWGPGPAAANVHSNKLTCHESFETFGLAAKMPEFNSFDVTKAMVQVIKLIGTADAYSARVKRAVFKMFNRELGADLWLAKETFVYRADLQGWAYVGSIASPEMRTGLFISLDGHVVLYNVTNEILDLSNLNFSLVQGNYVTMINNPALQDQFHSLLEEMILMGQVLSPRRPDGTEYYYDDFLSENSRNQ